MVCLQLTHSRCTYSPLMATAHSVYSTYSQHIHTPSLSYSEVTHCLLTASPGYAAPRYCRLTRSSPSPWGTEGMEWDGGWGGWAAPRRDIHRLPHGGGTPRRSQSPGSTLSVDTPGLLLQQRRYSRATPAAPEGGAVMGHSRDTHRLLTGYPSDPPCTLRGYS